MKRGSDSQTPEHTNSVPSSDILKFIYRCRLTSTWPHWTEVFALSWAIHGSRFTQLCIYIYVFFFTKMLFLWCVQPWYYINHLPLKTFSIIPSSIASDLLLFNYAFLDTSTVSEQCRIVASLGNQILGMIRMNITYKEKGLIVPLYKEIVRPHLEYCTGMEAVSQEEHRHAWKNTEKSN